jgi:hypothetical protein
MKPLVQSPVPTPRKIKRKKEKDWKKGKRK